MSSPYQPKRLIFKDMAERLVEKQTEAGRRSNSYGFGRCGRAKSKKERSKTEIE